MNYTGPKVRMSRKLGIPVTPKAMKVMLRKPYPPGQHVNSRRLTKLSDYGKQLLEKQRLRFQYNLSERQLRNYYRMSAQMKGNTAENLIRTLESRLDAFVLRAGLAPTIYAARQFVGHGHVLVNDKRVNLPSYRLEENDVVTVREKGKTIPALLDSWEQASPPPYVTVDKEAFKATFSRMPTREEVPVTGELALVVEFYSR